MVGNGGNPNDVDDNGRTGRACRVNGNLQIAAILIRARARLNDKDRLGNTALHYAADRNQVEMAPAAARAGVRSSRKNKTA